MSLCEVQVVQYDTCLVNTYVVDASAVISSFRYFAERRKLIVSALVGFELDRSLSHEPISLHMVLEGRWLCISRPVLVHMISVRAPHRS